MGIEVILAAASLAVSAYSTIQQQSAQEEAADAQKKANEEQKAANAAQAAQERRAQIREERAKRARMVQSSENSGVTASSGEIGASGSLSTNLGANIGFNLGQLQTASNISDLNQSAQNHIQEANMWGGVGSLGLNIFNASGGFKNFSMSQAPAPVVDKSTIFKG